MNKSDGSFYDRPGDRPRQPEPKVDTSVEVPLWLLVIILMAIAALGWIFFVYMIGLGATIN